MADKQRKCAVCACDMLPWDNLQACIKWRNDRKGKDKCCTGKESDCSISAGSLKIPHKKKSSKSKSSEKFDDSLLDEPTRSKSSQRDSSFSQEQGMCALASQTRPNASEGELSDEDSNLPSRKRHRSRPPQGEADSHQQKLDPSYVEMLNAIRGLLDLEVPQVECLLATSAFSKKPGF